MSLPPGAVGWSVIMSVPGHTNLFKGGGNPDGYLFYMKDLNKP